MSNQTVIDHDNNTVTVTYNLNQTTDILVVMEHSQNCRDDLDVKKMEQDESKA